MASLVRVSIMTSSGGRRSADAWPGHDSVGIFLKSRKSCLIHCDVVVFSGKSDLTSLPETLKIVNAFLGIRISGHKQGRLIISGV